MPTRPLSCFFIALFLLTNCAANGGDEPCLVFYFYDRMPYYGGEEESPSGILVDIVKLVMDEAGIPYVFKKLPKMRILSELAKTEKGGSMGWSKTKEREGTYEFSAEPIYHDESMCLIAHKDRADQLKNKTIKEILTNKLTLGLYDGSVYGEWLDGNLALYSPTVERVKIGEDTAKLYAMLSHKRFDYSIAGLEESFYAINMSEDFKKHLEIIAIIDAPPTSGIQRYLLFSKGIDTSWLDKINCAISKVKHTDAYKSILEKAKK